MILPFLTAMGFVVLAEMGDKTQLLAMAFAAKYRWQTVMWAVLVATLANHLFAVVVGSSLASVIPLHYIQIAAAASFIFFGLWTLKGDKLEGEDKKFNYSPFWTVAIAFFLAEMGDKTQLATVALATKYQAILPVWFGTTTGMMIADGFGIIVGMVLGRKIPERAVKWFAAIVFILFGVIGLYHAVPGALWNPGTAFGGLALLALLVWVVVRRGARRAASKAEIEEA